MTSTEKEPRSTKSPLNICPAKENGVTGGARGPNFVLFLVWDTGSATGPGLLIPALLRHWGGGGGGALWEGPQAPIQGRGWSKDNGETEAQGV